MPEFIIRAEETDLFFLFKNYKELIRCKDCQNYCNEKCDFHGFYMDSDDFCSRAERKVQ